ncbi:DUF659 domain-containing protein [Aphis craccivora]|uniref:DUF659 domain-containing protein n=1 Tax=Aphis craccivora TaxID=307492 RepID=A0A6G0ZJV6_APHCR|nr:DUF659 domain-containing protein [Aphis craccivora]
MIIIPSQVTSWETWLNAALYYCKNFDKIKESMLSIYLMKLSNFQQITETILKIEKLEANLQKTISLVQNVEIKLSEEGIDMEFTKIKLILVLS